MAFFRPQVCNCLTEFDCILIFTVKTCLFGVEYFLKKELTDFFFCCCRSVQGLTPQQYYTYSTCPYKFIVNSRFSLVTAFKYNADFEFPQCTESPSNCCQFCDNSGSDWEQHSINCTLISCHCKLYYHAQCTAYTQDFKCCSIICLKAGCSNKLSGAQGSSFILCGCSTKVGVLDLLVFSQYQRCWLKLMCIVVVKKGYLGRNPRIDRLVY